MVRIELILILLEHLLDAGDAKQLGQTQQTQSLERPNESTNTAEISIQRWVRTGCERQRDRETERDRGTDRETERGIERTGSWSC